MAALTALIFDCDGVIVDTERDGHRVAFNRAFEKMGIKAAWDVKLYSELLAIAGGKERMRHFFDTHGWPAEYPNHDALIRNLHSIKTDLFMDIIESGQLPLRPGVARLVDEAIAAGMDLAVCSTSNERAVNLVLEKMLGLARKAACKVILAGDVVAKKKPDPEIYLLALKKLGRRPNECVVVEDSRNGLRAALAAGIPCLVTTNGYTETEDFTGALQVLPELGDPPNIRVDIAALRKLVQDRTA